MNTTQSEFYVLQIFWRIKEINLKLHSITTLFIGFSILLTGCSTLPTVHLYAKYLDNHQAREVKRVLEQTNQYHVELNSFDFPASITENTLLYSLLLKNGENIQRVSALSKSIGFPIAHNKALAQGNHWYTKDALALFLFPAIRNKEVHLFWQDLVHNFKGENCGADASLALKRNSVFVLEIATAEQDNSANTIEGMWKYRQFPYLELEKHGSDYSEYYFEIKHYSVVDQISEIAMLELTSLNTGHLPEDCKFLFGQRL